MLKFTSNILATSVAETTQVAPGGCCCCCCCTCCWATNVGTGTAQGGSGSLTPGK
ncbi:streptolysin S family TOMM toxin [Streptococcus porcinus]|uniref:Streptolysin S family bacteriocin n=1 Tax=Streptococcus porcinus TaxID=1340 RepID=A0A7V9WSD2_STRPO|nr:streptolysin S family TOMM toxin [Streptococcus porcinus]MBA2796202.1 streptolysin S family bacteriocin [Streptococcus porcinus]